MTGNRSFLEQFYGESRFGGFTGIDGTVAFYTRVRSLLEPHHIVIDVGCGKGDGASDPVRVRRDLRVLKGLCRRMIGLDVDRAAASNPLIDEFRHVDGARWPVSDCSTDLIVADWVVEHLERPEAFFAEGYRVLREGGHLCVRTPNLLSYFGLAARLVPNRFHQRVRNLVQERAMGEILEAWRTFYRCNTKAALGRALRAAGFHDLWVGGYEPEPAYLSFSRIAYRLGTWYAKFAPESWRTNLFAFARKGQL